MSPPPGGDVQGVADTSLYFAVSPAGDQLAFVATAGGKRGIWVRSLQSAGLRFVTGTDNARTVFWSPDGRELGFTAGNQLKRVSVDGGPAIVLCTTRGTGTNGTWSRDGVIVYDEWGGRDLMKVSQDGGTPVAIRRDSRQYGWPSFLPDGRHFLYAVPQLGTATAAAFIGSLDSSDDVPLAGVPSRAEYAAGNVLFWQEGALMARPFDVTARRFTGEAVTLTDHVQGFVITGFAAFAAAGEKAVAVHAGSPANRLVWMDRQGRDLSQVGPTGDIATVALSPDGSSVAFSLRDPRLGTGDIGIYDLARNTTRRFTADRGAENSPLWSADGQSIVYAADRRGPPHLHARTISSVNDERQLTAPSTGGAQFATSITPDGKLVIFTNSNPDTGFDIDAVPFDGSAPPRPLVQTKASESQAVVSPDGRWLAYVSNESGDFEVYVAPFADPQKRWQVSSAGGVRPRWSRSGRELYFLEANARINVVAVPAGPTFAAGVPRTLFARSGIIDYDVGTSEDRFLAIVADPAGAMTPLTLTLNWPQLLRTPRP